ncbi:MAG: glutamate-cysteine ligase family protein [Candidatus Helarchaeota archaeon]
MTRFYVVCPRCKFESDFAPTKIKVGDLIQCLKCKLNIKVTNICFPENYEGEFEEEVVVEPHITNGIEIESYLIKGNEIMERSSIQPVKDVVEPGEEFTNDMTIGNEYISPIFDDINEGLFLLKNGLRKYRAFTHKRTTYQIGLLGTWLKDPAGVHIHIGFGEEGIGKADACALMVYLHDYLPFLIALCANSPIFVGKITTNASNRVLQYGKVHCKSISKTELQQMRSDHWVEINYNDHRKDKPPTIEIRVLDSNIPEYIIAAVVVLRVLAIAFLKGKASPNTLSFEQYEISKLNAAKEGANATLYWNSQKLKVAQYIDRFFDNFYEELEKEDLTTDILDIFRWAKLGWNNATIIKTSVSHIKSLYSSKKYNWEKQFFMRYNEAISSLLDGNNLIDYARILYVDLPDIRNVKIGRKHSI